MNPTSPESLAPGSGSAARCGGCGESNRCQHLENAAEAGACWCGAWIPAASQTSERACLCRECLPKTHHLLEKDPAGEADGYTDPDTGFWVFSRAYHLRRGSCCGNGCRHCPWPEAEENQRPAFVLAPMLVLWVIVLLVGAWTVSTPAWSTDWIEEFDHDPTQHGWQAVGAADLFQWEAIAGTLRVHWDSSRSNSFFVLPLGTTLSTADPFAFEFEITLDSVGPRVPERPSILQVAAGLVRRDLLPDGMPARLTGSARDLVEWDWFPASDIPGFGGSPDVISPAVFGDAGTRAFSFDNYFNPGDGATWRVRMTNDPVRRVVETRLWRNGVEQGPVNPVRLTAAFGDTQVDSFAVINWSEASTRSDSLEAVGHLDHIRLQFPDPPLGPVTMQSPGVVAFNGAAGWTFTLLASGDLIHWAEVASAPGTGGAMVLADPRDGVYATQFYRVRADR